MLCKLEGETDFIASLASKGKTDQQKLELGKLPCFDRKQLLQRPITLMIFFVKSTLDKTLELRVSTFVLFYVA